MHGISAEVNSFCRSPLLLAQTAPEGYACKFFRKLEIVLSQKSLRDLIFMLLRSEQMCGNCTNNVPPPPQKRRDERLLSG